jgi:hypothetical protein
MAKKKKSKLKKFLKGAALAGAAALGAKALMGNKGMSDKFLASGAAGGARLPKGDAFARARKLMTSNPAYGNEGYTDEIRRRQPLGSRSTNPTEFLIGVGSDPIYPGIQAGAKKGGRAGKDFGKRGVGKAKRGFGRALKGGKK